MIEYLRTAVGGWCLLAADALEAAADVLIPADPYSSREPKPVRSNGRPDPEHVSGRVAEQLRQQHGLPRREG